jgi:hypothetical protein
MGGKFMAKLGPYFGSHTGAMRIVDFIQVGSGSFTEFADYAVQFSGTLTVPGHEGPFTLKLNLADQSPTSVSGPCKIAISNQSDNAATYVTDGQKLTVTTTLNAAPVDIYASGNGTRVDNVSGYSVSIEP